MDWVDKLNQWVLKGIRRQVWRMATVPTQDCKVDCRNRSSKKRIRHRQLRDGAR